jgi:catechol 2,3-dioxygenase-like lactoylglutathione lyase family enzyme
MVRTEGLTHIDLRVSDVARSLGFYNAVFGVEELFRDGPDEVFVRTPGSRDVIGLSKGNERVGVKGGIGHFGFRLVNPADIDQAISEVERAGGKLLRRGGQGKDAYAYVSDPDGYEVELFCD